VKAASVLAQVMTVIPTRRPMSEMTPKDYLVLRRRYQPEIIKLVIVAESPPVGGKYFYKPEGKTTEPLFAALMKQLLDHRPHTKEEGLREFQRRGWVLVDATYEPVNTPEARRDSIIERDYPSLLEDLKGLISDRAVPLILIKANVCRVLEPKLLKDRFNVVNRGLVIYFPSNGRQTEFYRQFSAILKSAGIC
jgi:hypothetical protein